MKKYTNSLNEEINRMKSLFTEERMFGNLITEDVNGDSVEDYSNLLKSNGFEQDQLKNESERYTKVFNQYNIVKVKNAIETNDPEEDIKKIDFNRATLQLSITLKKDSNNIVTSWESVLSFGADKELVYVFDEKKDKFIFKSTEGNVNVDDFKKQLTTVLSSDWFKSKSGTNPEFSTKQDAGDVKQQRKDNVSATRKEINMSKDECRDHVKDMYKQVRQGKTKEEFEKGDIQGVEFCMRNFYQTFEKEGLFRKGDEIRIMYKTLGLKPTEKMIELGAGKDDEEITGDTFDDAKAEGGVEGERYVVKDQNGTKVAIIRKVGANKFNFRSKVNIPLVDKNDKGNIKFNKSYVSSIYKELNIDPNKQRIVIQKATETDKMDVGTFVLTNV
jgi:ribosome-binding protein aMBF1 (putative translation factor)